MKSLRASTAPVQSPARANEHPETVARGLAAAGALALALFCFAMWVLTTHYQGFGDDAQLYALQALGKLHPDTLGHDVFLQFASQDRYTVFSPIYAQFVEHLGLARSASLLTLLFHAISIAAIWSIARCFGDRRLAALAVGLALVVPGTYGAGDTFQYRESFLTARLAAESAGLIAIALWLRNRRWGASIAAVLTAALHPLVAAPLLAMGGLAVLRGLKLRRPAHVLSLAAAAIAVIAAAALIGGLRPLSGEWLSLVQGRSNYLFPTTWSLQDWSLNLLPLLSLALGGLVLPESPRRFATALASIGLAGLATSVIAGDLIPLAIVTQVQPWRWIWLPKLMSVLLLPATLSAAWRSDARGRFAAVMLGLAWVTIPVAGLAIGAASIAFWLGRRHLTERIARLAMGAIALAVGTIFALFVISTFETASTRAADPWLVERMIDLTANSGLLMLLVAGCWWLTARRPSVAGTAFTIFAAVAILASRGPVTWSDWTHDPYSPAARQQFAHWRELIPPNASVLWLENPAATWFLLDRASYVSQTQSAGIVFSERTAVEVARRARVIEPVADPRWLLYFGNGMRDGEEGTHPLTPAGLHSICTDPTLKFLVSNDDIGGAVATLDESGPFKGLHLYSCAT